MGLSSAKTKTTSTSSPYTAATPQIDYGLTQNRAIFDAQSPRLDSLADTAQSAFNAFAPTAFAPSQFVTGAQNAASQFTNGAYLGGNPGAATYSRLQNQTDPSLGVLSGLAGGSTSPGDYAGIGQGNPGLAALQALSGGGYSEGANAAAGYDQTIIDGKYLGANPGSAYYTDVLSGKYLDAGNPYLQSRIDATANDVTKAANRRFSNAGLGSGYSTAASNILTTNLANSANALRYEDYNNERARMAQAGSQADSAFANERGNMEGASGRISSNFNAAQNRALEAQQQQLAAATNLGSLYNQTSGLNLSAQQARDSAFQTDRSAQLAAAGQLGQQFTAGNNTALNAAQGADGARQAELQQMLSALGLTGGLTDAQYAGINPLLNLGQFAAQTPWTGLQAYSGALNNLAGRYGTQTGTTTGNPGILGGIGQAVAIGADAKSLFSDRRLKTDIKRVGITDDGLPVYTYRYVMGGPVHMGVMADEVAARRPDALGVMTEGFATVNYGEL